MGKKLGIANLALITYFIVCAGPYGIEQVVKAVGPGIAIVTIAILPIFLSFPLSMIYSEMGSLYPQRGSTVMWGQAIRANVSFMSKSKLQKRFVNVITHIYANTLFLKAVSQNAIPSSLIAGYLENLWEPFGSLLWRYLISIVAFALVFALNLYGIDAVGASQYVFAALVLTPIILLICFSLPWWDASKLSFANGPETRDYGLLLSNLVWQCTGFDLATNLSGEVSRPRKTYPAALTIVIVLIIISLMVPIVAGSMIEPDYEVWENAAFSQISLKISYCSNGWLEYWLIGAGAVSSLSVLNAYLACTSREIYCNALSGLLPFGSFVTKLIVIIKKKDVDRKEVKDIKMEMRKTDDLLKGDNESTLVEATDLEAKLKMRADPQGEQEDTELLTYQQQFKKEEAAKQEPKGAVPIWGMVIGTIIPIIFQIQTFEGLLGMTSFCIATSMLCQMSFFLYAKFGQFGYYKTKSHAHGFSLPKNKALLIGIVIPPVICIGVIYFMQGYVPFIYWAIAQALLLSLWGIESVCRKKKNQSGLSQAAVEPDHGEGLLE